MTCAILFSCGLSLYNAVMMIPPIAVKIPNRWSWVTRSFKKIIASVIVTTDKAEEMGVINIASPIVNP